MWPSTSGYISESVFILKLKNIEFCYFGLEIRMMIFFTGMFLLIQHSKPFLSLSGLNCTLWSQYTVYIILAITFCKIFFPVNDGINPALTILLYKLIPQSENFITGTVTAIKVLGRQIWLLYIKWPLRDFIVYRYHCLVLVHLQCSCQFIYTYVHVIWI